MLKATLLESFLRKMHKIQNLLGTILLLCVTALVFIQVILRYVLHMPLMGIEEMLMLPTIWLYMIGTANASLERNHIECGIATLFVKTPKGLCIFRLLRNVISCVVGFWLTKWAFWYLCYSLRMDKESALLSMPMQCIESAIFVGFFLMWVYSVLELLEDYINYRNKDFSSYVEEGI